MKYRILGQCDDFCQAEKVCEKEGMRLPYSNELHAFEKGSVPEELKNICCWTNEGSIWDFAVKPSPKKFFSEESVYFSAQRKKDVLPRLFIVAVEIEVSRWADHQKYS